MTDKQLMNLAASLSNKDIARLLQLIGDRVTIGRYEGDLFHAHERIQWCDIDGAMIIAYIDQCFAMGESE